MVGRVDLDNRLVLVLLRKSLRSFVSNGMRMGAKRHRLPLLTFAVSLCLVLLLTLFLCLFLSMIYYSCFCFQDSLHNNNMITLHSSFLPINPTSNKLIVLFWILLHCHSLVEFLTHLWGPLQGRPNFQPSMFSFLLPHSCPQKGQNEKQTKLQ